MPSTSLAEHGPFGGAKIAASTRAFSRDAVAAVFVTQAELSGAYPGAVDDGAGLQARRERAEGAAGIGGQAGGAERVGDGRVGVTQEQARLHGERHHFDYAAGD